MATEPDKTQIEPRGFGESTRVGWPASTRMSRDGRSTKTSAASWPVSPQNTDGGTDYEYGAQRLRRRASEHRSGGIGRERCSRRVERC